MNLFSPSSFHGSAPSHRILTFFLAAGLLAAMQVPEARAGLTIVTTEYSNSQAAATDVTGAGNLGQVFRAAADYWEDVFADATKEITVEVKYGWSPQGGTSLAVTTGGNWDSEQSAVTGSKVLFNNQFAWFLDVSPEGNSEYGAFAVSVADLGAGPMNVGRVYSSPGLDSPAHDRHDLFAVALHEIAHSMALTEYHDDFWYDTYWDDDAVELTAPCPFAGAFIPFWDAHIQPVYEEDPELPNVLMAPTLSVGLRRLPTEADIAAAAQTLGFDAAAYAYEPNFFIDPDSDYAAFQAFYFTLSEIAAGSADRAHDLDEDGSTNEREYFFGGNPRDAGDLAGVGLDAIEHAGNTYPAVTFSRRIATGITYTVQVSDDLDEWGDATASMVGESQPEDNGDGSESVTLRYPVDTATAPMLFFRVRANE